MGFEHRKLVANIVGIVSKDGIASRVSTFDSQHGGFDVCDQKNGRAEIEASQRRSGAAISGKSHAEDALSMSAVRFTETVRLTESLGL